MVVLHIGLSAFSPPSILIRAQNIPISFSSYIIYKAIVLSSSIIPASPICIYYPTCINAFFDISCCLTITIVITFRDSIRDILNCKYKKLSTYNNNAKFFILKTFLFYFLNNFKTLILSSCICLLVGKSSVIQ